MQFIGLLSTSDRTRLLAEGSVRHLDQGQYLLRRGEKGGDIYLVEAGSLEVVDSRQSPEIILEILGPGRIVGEMAFVDEAARSADVRSLTETTVRHWSRDVLLRMLERDPALSSRFYQALSSSAVQRLRSQDHAVGPTHSIGPVGGISAVVADEAREIAIAPRTAWRSSEALFSEPGQSERAQRLVCSALNELVDDVEAWISGINNLHSAREAGSLLRTELRHWLVRSRTGLIGVDHGGEQGPKQGFLAHLLLDRPEGSDQVGEALDKAILSLPTPAGVRGRMLRSVDEVVAALPKDRPANVTILQPSCGALLARLLPRMVALGGTVSCVDGDPQVLAFADAGLRARPVNIELNMVHQDLVALSEGRVDIDLPLADIVVMNGLVDHLPARLIGSLLKTVCRSLSDDGVVVFSGLAPSKDTLFMGHLLRWPLMRRTADELAGLCRAAGFTVLDSPKGSKVDDVGLVLVAAVSANGQR